jgi:hypothetical protein
VSFGVSKASDDEERSILIFVKVEAIASDDEERSILIFVKVEAIASDDKERSILIVIEVILSLFLPFGFSDLRKASRSNSESSSEESQKRIDPNSIKVSFKKKVFPPNSTKELCKIRGPSPKVEA